MKKIMIIISLALLGTSAFAAEDNTLLTRKKELTTKLKRLEKSKSATMQNLLKLRNQLYDTLGHDNIVRIEKEKNIDYNSAGNILIETELKNNNQEIKLLWNIHDNFMQLYAYITSEIDRLNRQINDLNRMLQQ